jgi:hypothetical protein
MNDNSSKSKKKNARHSATLTRDAKGYYEIYETDEKSARDSLISLFHNNLVGECYIGFSKLLQSELRKFEKRDSNILSNRVSSTANRLSYMY